MLLYIKEQLSSGFWKNWRNQYTQPQIQVLVDYLKANNKPIYDATSSSSDDLTWRSSMPSSTSGTRRRAIR
jgi:hypothetical protein